MTSFNGFSLTGATLTGVDLAWDMRLDLNLSADYCQSFGDCEPSEMQWSLGGGSGAFAHSIFDHTSLDYGFNIGTDDLQVALGQKLYLKGSKSFTNFDDFLGGGIIGEVKNFWASLVM